MWQYHNPVNVIFGDDAIDNIDALIAGKNYVLVTYNHPYFTQLAARMMQHYPSCQTVLNQVHENPDLMDLDEICTAFKPFVATTDLIIALGGGSVIDTAKALAVALDDAKRVERILLGQVKVQSALPIIAIPTTTGTGSEMTCWGTIWDKANNTKYSLNDSKLYPIAAVCDPKLTLTLPVSLTIQTGLDALSHAMESIWNVNRNPISLNHASFAIKEIISILPKLAHSPEDLGLRHRMMLASVSAGYAFSNTKTSIAHNISYAVTLTHGTAHGIACAFTLPSILSSFNDEKNDTAKNLRKIFGVDLNVASNELSIWMNNLGIETSPSAYGYNNEQWTTIVQNALQGERGKNFSGSADTLIQSFNF